MALTPNPLLQHSWRATQFVINQFNSCILYFFYYLKSPMQISKQAFNVRVCRRAWVWGYFILVDALPFICIASCSLNISWLWRSYPWPAQSNMKSRQSPSCRSFSSPHLITQKSSSKHTKSAHSPATTAHAVTGSETHTRSMTAHCLTGQIQYCNFMQAKAAVSRLCQDVFKQKKYCKQINVICNRTG